VHHLYNVGQQQANKQQQNNSTETPDLAESMNADAGNNSLGLRLKELP